MKRPKIMTNPLYLLKYCILCYESYLSNTQYASTGRPDQDAKPPEKDSTTLKAMVQVSWKCETSPHVPSSRSGPKLHAIHIFGVLQSKKSSPNIIYKLFKVNFYPFSFDFVLQKSTVSSINGQRKGT